MVIMLYLRLFPALRLGLVQFYKERASYRPLSPMTSEVNDQLDKFYVAPEIRVLKANSTSDTQNASSLGNQSNSGEIITSYKDVFWHNGRQQRHIYCQGEPGAGKSVFATKVALDWSTEVESKAVENPHNTIDPYFTDKTFLSETFDFVFLIALRETDRSYKTIEEMIHGVLIPELTLEYHIDPDQLRTILAGHRVLIVLDGLDEWNTGQRSRAILTRQSSYTVLTLTRPWILCETGLRDVDHDVLFELCGVANTDLLLEKVLSCLSEQFNRTKDLNEFIHLTTEKKYPQSVLAIPILAVQLLCLWFEEGSLAESKTEIYKCMVDMLVRNVDTEDSCYPENNTFFQSLERLAFYTLYSEVNHQTLVFNSSLVMKYLSKQYIKRSLQSGLLTEHRNYTRSLRAPTGSFSFLHKTFQEFLAARYICGNNDECLVVLDRTTQETASVWLLAPVILLVCGLQELHTATKVFKIMTTVVATAIERRASDDHAGLSVIGTPANQSAIHQYVWRTMKIWIDIVQEGRSNGLDDQRLFDCLTLKHMYLSSNKPQLFEEFILHASQSRIHSLEYVSLKGIFSPALCASSGIKYLCLIEVTGSINIDLTQSHNLTHLVIENSRQCTVLVDNETVKLRSCLLRRYDLTNGGLSEYLIQTECLEQLTLGKCDNIRTLCQSIHKKTKLRRLCITNARLDDDTDGDIVLPQSVEHVSFTNVRLRNWGLCMFNQHLNLKQLKLCNVDLDSVEIDLTKFRFIETVDFSRVHMRLTSWKLFITNTMAARVGVTCKLSRCEIKVGENYGTEEISRPGQMTGPCSAAVDTQDSIEDLVQQSNADDIFKIDVAVTHL